MPSRMDPDLRSQLLQMSTVLGEIGTILCLMADDLYKALERDQMAAETNGKAKPKWLVDAGN